MRSIEGGDKAAKRRLTYATNSTLAGVNVTATGSHRWTD